MNIKSTTESGTSTYVGNFDELTGICDGFGPAYSPKPDYLKIPALKTQSVHIKASINDVDYGMSNVATAEDARQKAFALLPPLATRVLAAATVLGLPDVVLVRIKEVVRKIRGDRAKPIKVEPLLEDEEPKKHISVSQKSFNEQIEHFHQLITYVAPHPEYAPTEDDLTVPSLRKLKDKMGITNDGAREANRILDDARDKRNALLYAPGTGMMDTALAVKEYVKAAFGTRSPQYKAVKSISFKNKKF
ncbi:MAG: hypothetical protein LBS54_03875 [Dysgonamonadaceae bacterium]|jgi:hypothetical protein|nr:hypothetical protein [Dysgonamonadaceae bacterium]